MNEFNALLYGAPSNDFVNYTRNSMGNFVNNVSDSARKYIKQTGQFFHDKYTSNKAIDRIKEVYSRAGQATGRDVITYMQDPTYSKPLMQRYIMAHPHMYSLAKDNHINGFNATLSLDERVDPYENEDYQAATSGWLLTDSHNEYPVEYITTEQPLSISEQLAILDTYDICNIMIADGLDPTCPNDN